jgi:hypothetical protein
LYGCETWSLTLREEHRLRVFVNRVLRGIFGPKRDGVTVECRRLHNEELNDLCSSPNIIRVIKSRRMRWAGHVASMCEGRGAYRVLVGRPGGRRPLGRPVKNVKCVETVIYERFFSWIFCRCILLFNTYQNLEFKKKLNFNF